MDLPDDELVRRAQRGDREAFTLLIRRFERPALAVAFAVSASGEAAGDAVQDAFIRAWERLAELRDPVRFGPWLCGIVRNLARDAARKDRRELEVRAALPAKREAAIDPAMALERRESDRRITAALAELDEITRTAVVLRYYENLSSKQIGELLELAPSAVDMRLSRARAELRKLLDDEK